MTTTPVPTTEQPLTRRYDDVELTRIATRAIEWSASIPSDQVQVQVQRGRAILTGAVRREYQRQAVEKAVHLVPGLQGIDNYIQIREPVIAGF